MIIWVTRQRAFSIQFSGIDRLDVWFQEPRFYKEFYHTDDMPFGYREEGCLSEGWRVSSGKIQNSLSFGGLFGYIEDSNLNKELVEYVWNELCKHFGNVEFEMWDEYEKEGKCNVKDFILKIDLDIKMKKQ